MNKGKFRTSLTLTLIATLICCICGAFCAFELGKNTAGDIAQADAAIPAVDTDISLVSDEDDDLSSYDYILSGSATTNASLWTDAINESVNNRRQVKVLLATNWTAANPNSTSGFGSGTGFNSGRLYLPQYADIVLNLQTYTLSRGVTSAAISYGNVIYMATYSKLTIRGTTGSITGGWTTNTHGGGIYTDSYCTINIQGGNITGNKINHSGYYGGGIYVNSYGVLNMTGGSISNNSTLGYAGGVHIGTGEFYMSGDAEISNNTAGTYAGGIYASSTTVNISGNAKIYGNKATTYCGGIWVNYPLTISGNAEIYNNTAGQNGGAIWREGNFNLEISGAAKIYENSCGAGYYGGGVYMNVATTNRYYIVFDSEDAEVYGNYRGTDKNDRTDFYLNWGNKIKFNIKLRTDKVMYVYAKEPQYVFTENYDACYSATSPSQVFAPEDDSLTIQKVGKELFLGDTSDAWAMAVSESMTTGEEVTFEVNSNWNARTDSVLGTTFGGTSNSYYTGPYYYGALCVPQGANIRLVLNANINRGLTSAVSGGMVIAVYYGTLTIEGTGSITGGYNTGSGGGIYLAGSTTYHTGILNIEGCNITGNKANGHGGGIYGGGGTINMTGGTISGNYCAMGGLTTANYAGGIYSTGPINVSGTPKVTGNYRYSTSYPENILISSSIYKINVVGALSSGASLGISPHIGPKIITEGFSTYHPTTSATTYFSSDISSYSIVKNSINNELAITDNSAWANAVINSLVSGGNTYTVTVSSNLTAGTAAPNIYHTAFGFGNNIYGAYYMGALCVPNGASINLIINSNITINRNLTSSTAIADGRVIYVSSGGTLNISGSGTIRGGWALSSGGGIYNAGTLTMTGVTITGNYGAYTGSHYTGYQGGGVCNAGTFTMNGGTISGNYSGYQGGGVYSSGTFNFYGGNITGNYTAYNYGGLSSGSYNYGGGVYFSGGIMNVKGSGTIASNNYTYYKNDTTLNYSYVNSGLTIPSAGVITIVGSFTGSIYFYCSTGNRAFTSGAGANGVTSTSRFTLNSTAIGGLYYNSTIKEYTVGSLSTDAWTTAVFGSIGASSPSTYQLPADWVPTSGISLGTAAGYFGGAILVPSGANIIIDLNGHNIDRKSTTYTTAYAIYIEANAKVRIIDSSGKKGYITGGYGSNSGGSVYASGNNISLTLDGVTIKGNRLTASSGGGIYYYSIGGTLNINDCVITDNVTYGGGGGIYIGGNANTVANITDSVISNNSAAIGGNTYCGGGIYWASGNLNLKGCEISGNYSGYTGGGLWMLSSASYSCNITDGKIVNNVAKVMGGGVYLSGYASNFGIGGSVEIYGNTLEDGSDNNIGLYSLYTAGTTAVAKVTILSKLTSENRIGIAAYDITHGVDLTKGFSDVYGKSFAPSKVFKLDNAVGVLALSDNGEVCIHVGDQWLIAVQQALQEPDTVQTLVLSGDWLANVGIFGYDDSAYTATGAMYVPAGVNIVVDLAGWTINRGLEALQSGGAIFYIADGAKLTIIDSSTGKTGTITGGWNDGNGGAFNVSAGGTLIIYGGNITENRASGLGGGVYFEDGSQLEVGGSAHIFNNFNLDGELSNLYIANGQKVIVSSEFVDEALIYVTLGTANGLGEFTTGYGDNNVDAEGDIVKPYLSFASDEEKAVALSNQSRGDEVTLYDDSWLAAVQKSLQTDDVVEYTITSDWNGNGAFRSATSGDEGTAYLNGALYIPENAQIIINAGSHNINRGLGTAVTVNGSVFVVDGTLTVNGGTVLGGNNSGNGGGFIVKGELSLVGTNVSSNKASGNGGGIFVDGGTLVVDDGTVIRLNTADNGAGVFVAKGDVTFKAGSTVLSNVASSYGGGLYIEDGDVVLEDGSAFTSNTAVNGAGIYVAGGTLTADGATIDKNEASQSGGGLYVEDGVVSVENGAISENKADNGAGIYAVGGQLELNGALAIEGNVAGVNGGGLYVAAGSDVAIDGVSFADNSATANGGGIYVADGADALTLNDVTASGNTAENGGFMFVLGEVVLTGGSYTGNEASANGGAIYLDEGGKLTMSGSVEIKSNEAADFGGGVYVNSDGFIISGGIVITDNVVGNAANNVYLANKNVINLADKITGADISVTMEATGTFTGGWNDYYDLVDDDPSDYFSSDMLMTIAIKDGETEVRMGVIRPTWIFEEDGKTTYPYTINTPYNGKAYTQYATVPVAGLKNWDVSATIGNNYGSVGTEKMWVGGTVAAEYVITFTLAEGYGWFDYDGTVFKLVWNIDAVVVDVNWTFGSEWRQDSDVVGGYVREYDGKGYEVTVSVSSTSGDVTIYDNEYEIRYSKVGSADSSLTAPKDAGEYYAFVNIKSNTNFRVESTSQALFRITPRVLTLTWYDEDGVAADSNARITYQYAAANHTVSAELSAKTASIGILEGDVVNAIINYYYNQTLTTSVREVGEYSAVSTTLDNSNYVLDTDYECVITIIAYKLTLDWINKTVGSWEGSGQTYEWEYNGLAVDLEVDGELFDGDTLTSIGLGTVSYEQIDEEGNYTLVSKPTNVGNYKATVAVRGNQNYDIQNAVMYFEITPKTVVVSWQWSTQADNDNAEVTKDGNIMLRYDGTSNHIPYAYIADEDKLNVYYQGGLVSLLKLSVLDSSDSFVSPMGAVVETETVHAVLAQNDGYDSSFYDNFVIDVETGTQVFEIGRFVIPDAEIIWTDANGDSYQYNTALPEFSNSPQYKWQTISGTAGPGFSAYAIVSLGYVSYEFRYDADRYLDANGNVVTDVNYGSYWPVDEVRGYSAVIKLTEEHHKLFEFENGTDETTITFYVVSVMAEKEDVTVIWLVKYNNTYYTINESGDLVEFTGTVVDNSLPEAGFVEAVDGKFALTYNGKAQSPIAVYEKDGEYALLNMVIGTKATNVGNYKASLAASNTLNYNEGGMECEYSIAALKVNVEWSGNDTESHLFGKFEWTYDGNGHSPVATAKSAVEGITLTVPSSAITVNSAVNAGSHTAVATLSDNFIIASGGTQDYTINKFKLGEGTVKWSADDMMSDTAATKKDDYFWWYFDGYDHLPTPSVSFTMSNGTHVTLDLVVSGATKQVGTHYAYAVLDSTKLINNNYELAEAKCMFVIHKILISNVYWTNSDENSDDTTVIVGGNELLAFTYNGEEQAPRAYYLGDDGSRVYLDVFGAMIEANVYVARIVNEELDFDEGLATSCTYVIVPRPLDITWSGDDNLVYDGQKHTLSVTLDNVVTGETLVEGVDYTVTGFVNAGTHKAIITFLNNNYTYGDSNSYEFTIAKFDLADLVEWTAVAEDNDKLTIDGEDISWQYNAKAHNPVLKDIETQTDADKLFINDVEFKFSYTGAATTVGTHTARAVIVSATSNGVDVTDNFTLTSTKQFAITEYVIEVIWAGNADNDDKFEWTYDGNEHAPTATYVDWNGDTQTFATVSGARTEAGPSYLASVTAPLNCVFSTEEGKGGEISFAINRAQLTVVWKYENGDTIGDNEVFSWVYDGESHAPDAFVGDEQLDVMGARTDAGVGYVASTTYGNPNYELTNATVQFNITAKSVNIKWIGNPDNAGDAEKEFTWVYPSGADKFVSPTAVLVDEDGEEILVDGKPVAVTVRGAANSVGSFVAYALDTFNNYDFADDNETWHVFTIVARPLQVSDLQWIADGATEDSGFDEQLGMYVFTYSYNGKPQFPVIKVDDDTFTYRIVSVKNVTTSAVTTNELPSEPGTWEVTFAPANSNYELPDEYAVSRIVITAKTVDVVWSTDKLVYNGANQSPYAWFIDVDGKEAMLDVTVDKAAYSAAGDYVATASLTSIYYALGENVTHEYTISGKEVKVEWNNDKTSWVYDGLGHTVSATATLADVLKTDLANVSVNYKITHATKPDVVNGTVKDVGTYTVVMYLSGSAAANYTLSSDKQEFTITPATLNVKANNAGPIEYGDRAPVYSATFSGFVNGETEESLNLVVGGAPRGNWISCDYTSNSLPDEYDIVISRATLASLLPNYNVVLDEPPGILVVNPKDATVIWVGQNNTKNFTYDGNEHLLTAYCYINGNRIDLTVSYATYANGVYTEVTDPDYAAINAGTYFAIARSNTTSVQLDNAETSYQILKKQVVVNIGGADGSVYTSTYGEAIKEITYTYAESPLAADIDKFVIGFDTDFVYDDGNFVIVNTDGYTITGKWSAKDPDDQTLLANNYNVTFVGEREAASGENSCGIYYVTEATIQIVNEKHSPEGSSKLYDDWHEYNPMATNFFISLANKTDGVKFDNIVYSGYQDAEVNIYYGGANSPENAPLPEEDTTYVLNRSTALTREGEYVINYKIEIANHVTLFGAWTVIITPASDEIAIVFNKTLEVNYGDGVPENLIDVLLGNYVVDSAVGMIRGEYITVYNITADEFISHATARAVNGNAGVDAATNVGNYDIVIDIESSTESVQRVVRYHADAVGEDTNIGKYAVVPRLLTVDWGDMKFDYEEDVTHLPTPVVSGWVTADAYTVEGIEVSTNGSIVYTTFKLTDANVEVTLKIGANNDFTSIGGHNLTISVESGNYRIAADNAYGTYSIAGEVTVTPPTTNPGETPPIVVEGNGMPDWLMYAILGGLGVIALLVIIAMFVRRGGGVAYADEGGFGEYYDDGNGDREEEDEDDED